MPATSASIRPLQTDEDAAAFYELNRRWISEYFTLTPEDERVLSEPRSAIIASGGEVLVAVGEQGAVVGVVAVLAVGDGVYELAKMTVDVAARGTGTGRLLIRSAIDWARAQGGRLLFLGSNTRLEAALRLYEEAGFVATTLDELHLTDYYARADVLMKIELA